MGTSGGLADRPAMDKVLVLVVTLVMETSCQLLGAGSGVGSCRAFPFRSSNVNWDVCPPATPCCSEYGYCRTRDEWKQLKFRDCNGVSNGINLPISVLVLEEQLREDSRNISSISKIMHKSMDRRYF